MVVLCEGKTYQTGMFRKNLEDVFCAKLDRADPKVELLSVEDECFNINDVISTIKVFFEGLGMHIVEMEESLQTVSVNIEDSLILAVTVHRRGAQMPQIALSEYRI